MLKLRYDTITGNRHHKKHSFHTLLNGETKKEINIGHGNDFKTKPCTIQAYIPSQLIITVNT